MSARSTGTVAAWLFAELATLGRGFNEPLLVDRFAIVFLIIGVCLSLVFRRAEGDAYDALRSIATRSCFTNGVAMTVLGPSSCM